MTKECWASKLGDRGGGLSREHYISDGVFDGAIITAYGLEWCKGRPVQISVARAVAKILCKRHNEMLSVLDSEASRLSRFLAANVMHDPLSDAQISLRGHLLEKWALKTFVNLGYVGGLDPEHHTRVQPHEDLVRYVFQTPIPSNGLGLYFVVTGAVSNHDFRGGLSWKGIRNLSHGGTIAGMAFALNGVHFVVSAEPGPADKRLRRVGLIGGVDYSQAKILYRPNNIALLSETAGRKSIFLEW
jgi:hypothetical protein